ncbi:lipopolysaccharide biosynthesis protein, partial [Streptomyces pilosus]
APEYGTRWAWLNATAGYGPGRPRPPAYDGEGAEKGGGDTVTLFIGHPGYEREALQADTLALIVRPHGPDAARAPADGSAADGRAAGPGTDHAPEPDRQG